MTQPDLFRDVPIAPAKRKKGWVPASSVEAYRARPRDARISHVLAMLQERTSQEPLTSHELAVMFFLKPTTDDLLYVRRGLSDAQAKGLVEHAGKRTCFVAKTLAVTWKVKSR